MASNAECLHYLFEGYEKRHGTFVIGKKNDKGKVEGRAQTVSGPATIEAWENHLKGEGPGLGIIPLREDDTLFFAAIDVDKYNLDPAAVEQRVGDLPLVVCRSKSGGIHLYLFLEEAAPAREVIPVISHWAAELGFGGCEIFPKQVYRASENDIGNWINMPWYGGRRGAFIGGRDATIEEFIDTAYKRRTTIEKMIEIVDAGRKGTVFDDGPPCLQTIEANGGFPEGTRNDGMFSVGIYLRKRFPDDWGDHLPKYNEVMCEPRLSLTELNVLHKSIGKKDYTYKCKVAPLAQVCNKRACRDRMYGIGTDGGDGAQVDMNLTKYVAGEDVQWAVEINGQRVMCDTMTLHNQAKFGQLCLERISRCPQPMKQERWLRMLDEKARVADVIESPVEASAKGNFLHALFERFCHGKTQAKRLDEILADKPFIDGGKVHFTSTALQRYLDEKRFEYKSMHVVWHWLREIGGSSEKIKLKGKAVNVWIVPEPNKIEDIAKPEQETFEDF